MNENSLLQRTFVYGVVLLTFLVTVAGVGTSLWFMANGKSQKALVSDIKPVEHKEAAKLPPKTEPIAPKLPSLNPPEPQVEIVMQTTVRAMVIQKNFSVILMTDLDKAQKLVQSYPVIPYGKAFILFPQSEMTIMLIVDQQEAAAMAKQFKDVIKEIPITFTRERKAQ